MNRTLRSAALGLGALAFLSGAAIAAMPSSGTVSPGSPAAWTGGPFTGANPTNNIPGSDGPDCSAVPNTCDDFLLTVAIPAGYTALNPTHVVTVRVQWPNSTNDFDVYILDPVTGTSRQSPAATSSDPEIAAWPVVDGTVTYKVRVAAFSTVNESYIATASIGAPSSTTPGSGQYALGTDVWSCNAHLLGDNPTGPPPTFDHSDDGEPAVKFDGNGKFYVSAITGVPAGCGMWSTTDACGQVYSFFGSPDEGAGGGDTELETATEKNPLGNYNVYMSSLTLANITTAVSFDGGNNYLLTPISTITPVVDRQWNATYGAKFCYLSYRNGATNPGNLLECVRLDYTGMGAPVVGPVSVVWAGLDPIPPRELGNMVTDRRPGANTILLMAGPNGEGNVYHAWTEEGHKVFVSVSHDFGTTWTHHLVWDGGVGSTFDHKFTWLAVDQAGNVHYAFSDDRNVYLSSSTDQAVTWSRPLRVNRGGASNIAIFPQIAAGSAGRVVITFYGHSGTSSQDPNAEWRVFVSRCQNALDPVPLFEEVQVSDRNFHHGQVCEEGLACACCRELTECFDIDIDPVDGSAALAYGAFAAGGTYISRQVAGASSIAGKTVTDRSQTCPNPANGCVVPPPVGSRCVLPGLIVVEDPTSTADVPPVPDPQQDIEYVGVAEPWAAGDKFVFTIKVTSLNLAALPPNAFWRVIWQGPGTGTANQHYVDVVNCAAGGLSSHYGHFTTGSVQDGPSDGFTLSADGSIQITIAKNKVGNAVPGTLLTSLNADARDIVGDCPPDIAAAFPPIDVTSSGQYLVAGNAYCAPLGVVCPANLVGGPGTYTLNFQVANPSAATRLAHVTASDANGWINGGPVSTDVGPLAPSQSAVVPVSITIPSGCTPNQPDPVQFQASAADLPISASASCVTDVTCGVLSVDGVPREVSFAVVGPNPFTGGTTLGYALPTRMPVRLEVFSLDGRRLRTLVSGEKDAGGYLVPLNLRDGEGPRLGPGVYFVSLTAGQVKRSIRVVAVD